MKKISIYAVLFACLIALNPLPLKADTPKTAMNTLISNPSILFFSGSTIAFGIGSLYFFIKSRTFWNTSLRKDGIAEVRAEIGKANAAKKQEPSIEARKALENAKIAASYGAISLLGVGYSGYLTYKAIQQAKS